MNRRKFVKTAIPVSLATMVGGCMSDVDRREYPIDTDEVFDDTPTPEDENIGLSAEEALAKYPFFRFQEIKELTADKLRVQMHGMRPKTEFDIVVKASVIESSNGMQVYAKGAPEHMVTFEDGKFGFKDGNKLNGDNVGDASGDGYYGTGAYRFRREIEDFGRRIEIGRKHIETYGNYHADSVRLHESEDIEKVKKGCVIEFDLNRMPPAYEPIVLTFHVEGDFDDQLPYDDYVDFSSQAMFVPEATDGVLPYNSRNYTTSNIIDYNSYTYPRYYFKNTEFKHNGDSDEEYDLLVNKPVSPYNVWKVDMLEYSINTITDQDTTTVTRASTYSIFTDKDEEYQVDTSNVLYGGVNNTSGSLGGFQTLWSHEFDTAQVDEDEESSLYFTTIGSKSGLDKLVALADTDEIVNHPLVVEAAEKIDSVCENMDVTKTADRLRVAMDFVQGFEYQITAIGVQDTYTPAQFISQGWGDCTSFSLLLYAVLSQEQFNLNPGFVHLPEMLETTAWSGGHVGVAVPFAELGHDSIHDATFDMHLNSTEGPIPLVEARIEDHAYIEASGTFQIGLAADLNWSSDKELHRV